MLLDPSVTSHSFEEQCHSLASKTDHPFPAHPNQDQLITQVTDNPSTGTPCSSKNIFQYNKL